MRFSECVPGKIRRGCCLICAAILCGMAATGCQKGKEISNSAADTTQSADTTQPADTTGAPSDFAGDAEPSATAENRTTSRTAATTSPSDSEEQTVAATPWVDPVPERNRTPVTVTQIVNKNGRRYVEKLGKPYLQYGVQITTSRRDFSEDMIEQFYAKAAEIEFKTVIKSIDWSSVEPEEGKYNLYTVSKMLEYARKYDLQIEMLWFGNNVCGSTSSAPEYVRKDTVRFPMKDSYNFDYTNEELLRKEQNALTQVLNYLYDNDTDRRVSVIQVLNEPNFAEALGPQKDAFLRYIDRLALTIKNSCYRTVTRVNLVINDSYLKTENTLPGEILALDGVDMVGPDVYTGDLEYYIKFANRFSTGDMAENIMHFAEAPGQMENYPKQVLNAFANDSGYNVYELKSYGNVDFDFGIFRSDMLNWIPRDGTQKATYQWDRSTKVAESMTSDIVILNRMINAISEQIASCPADNFRMIFRQQSGTIGSQTIRFVTQEERTANRIGAVLLASDGYYYLFTPAEKGYFQFDGKTIGKNASAGMFVNGAWKESASVTIADGNVLNVQKGLVYRIPADSLAG